MRASFARANTLLTLLLLDARRARRASYISSKRLSTSLDKCDLRLEVGGRGGDGEKDGAEEHEETCGISEFRRERERERRATESTTRLLNSSSALVES